MTGHPLLKLQSYLNLFDCKTSAECQVHYEEYRLLFFQWILKTQTRSQLYERNISHIIAYELQLQIHSMSSMCYGGARTAFYFLQFPYLQLIPLSCKPPNLDETTLFPLPTASRPQPPDWDEITRTGWFLKHRRFTIYTLYCMRP